MDSESDTQESPIPNSISFHFMALAALCMYLVTILTEGCSDDHGCMSRILSYLVFAWSTAINCDQPRSTWAIWRRNPLWSARVAACMWTPREVGIEWGGCRQHCRLNICRYIGWVDKNSIRSQDPDNSSDCGPAARLASNEGRWGFRNFARNCLPFSVIGCKGAQLVRKKRTWEKMFFLWRRERRQRNLLKFI